MDYYASKSTLLKSAASLLAIALLSAALRCTAYSQGMNVGQRDHARTILKTIKEQLKRNFYDPTFHGIDIEVRFKEADNQLTLAQSQAELYGILAQVMLAFDDPNTFLISPAGLRIVDYGWNWIMIGDRCYVNAVKPGSDAEMKGLRLGDEVLSISGYKPTRKTTQHIKSFLFLGQPYGVLTMVAQTPEHQPRTLEVSSKATLPNVIQVDRDGNTSVDSTLEKLDKELKSERVEIHADVMVWKMPSFSDEDRVADGIKKAQNYKSLILDLRDCHEITDKHSFKTIKKLQEFMGYLLDRDIKVADVKKRSEIKPVLAKARPGDAFKGKLVVIISSVTSAAAELFARIIQLEKRGIVIGDRSQGTTRLATMAMEFSTYGLNYSTVVYGLSISDRELILSDGQSLDGVGVTPDAVVLPTAADLANNRDPVLSHAAGLLDVRLSPERAGSLLNVERVRSNISGVD